MKDDDTRKNYLSGALGIFRVLLYFRIEFGNSDILSHLKTSNKNCTMISSTIQNEILKQLGLFFKKKKKVERVKTSKFYSISYDETIVINAVV